MKIIDDKDESLDDLIVRARGDYVLVNMIDDIKFKRYSSVVLKMKGSYPLMPKECTSMCISDNCIITGNLGGKISMYSHDLVQLFERKNENPITMMHMPDSNTLLCCDRGSLDRLLVYKIKDMFDKGDWLKQQASIDLSGKAMSLSASSKRAFVIVDEEFDRNFCMSYALDGSDKGTREYETYSFILAKGPSGHQVTTNNSKIHLDHDHSSHILDIKDHFQEQCWVTDVQFSKNIVVFSYTLGPAINHRNGFGFLSLNYRRRNVAKLLQPIAIILPDTSQSVCDSGFYGAVSAITQISLSPSGDYLAVLRASQLNLYEVEYVR